MKKLFVPYEIAVLAKEKGFNEPCFTHYTNEFTKKLLHPLERFKNYNQYPKLVSAPLYQQLIDWFDDQYIFISIETEAIGSDEWVYIFKIKYLPTEKQNLKRRTSSFEYKESFKEGPGSYVGGWNTRKEALTEAFKEAFKLI